MYIIETNIIPKATQYLSLNNDLVALLLFIIYMTHQKNTEYS